MNYLSKIVGPIKRPYAFFLSIGLMIISLSGHAQVSGTWNFNVTNNSPGYRDLGGGVIQLEDYNNTGSAGAAVIQTTTYNPCTIGSFSRCYEVYFDCPTNDLVADAGHPFLDQKGDGASFSFYPPSVCGTYNTGAIGSGGLGYDQACSKMLTLEFDTYSNYCTGNFDCYFGGGVYNGTNTNDEISLHKNGESDDNGLVTTGASTNTNAGNLEDNMAHNICITYTLATHILNVTIDGNTRFNYDMTGSPYEPCTYFGSTALNIAWGAGKYGATNNIIVNDKSSTTIAAKFPSSTQRPGCTVLPVTFISFAGHRSGKIVQLDWATGSEKSNQKFIIERKDDQDQWQAIGEVKGQGNSDSKVQYQYKDQSPAASKIYYRLKQVDLEGAFTYSNIVGIDTENDLAISTVPNPFEDVLTIGLNETGPYTIQIQDLFGKVVYQDTKENTVGGLTLSPAIPTGAYLLTVQNESSIVQQKIIKK